MMLLGIITAILSESILVVISLFILFSVILLSLDATREKRKLISVVMLIFFLFGSAEAMLVENHQIRCFNGYSGEAVTVKGYIASAPELKDDKVSYTVQVSCIRKGFRGQFTDNSGKVLLKTLADGDLDVFNYGSEITFEGILTPPNGIRNPGGFDYRMYLSQKGVGATVFAYPYTIKKGEESRGNFLVKAGLAIRGRIVDVIEKSLPEQQAGLLNGMLIGYRQGLSKEVQDAFRDAGLMHIMAVSGANVAFLILPVSLLLKLLGIRKKAANLMIIAFLNLFVCITGFEPSVLRAVFMACVLLVSSLLYREPDVYSAMAVSCIIMLAINPSMLFNIGFQLSYAATLGIVMLYANISKLVSCKLIPKKAADVLGATLAAQAGVLPITLIHFNRISLISVLPNILAAPLLEIITILGAIMAIVGQFSIILSRLIGYLNNVFLIVVLYITKWSSAVPYASITTITPSFVATAIYYVIVWFLFWYKPLKGVRLNMRYVAIGMSLVVILGLSSSIMPGTLDVIFLDVGQGDSTFIRTCAGKTILIDGGGSANPLVVSRVGELTVVPFLLDYGVASLDAVIATHAHADHIQGLMDVLKTLKVRRLIIPSLDDESCFEALLEVAEERGITVSRCSKGEIIKIDHQTTMYVLSPDAECVVDENMLNNTSLILKLCYGQTSIMFTGDAEADVEERLVLKDEASANLNADVIKIGHHGSDTSTSEMFLMAVDPEAAIVSTGRNNFGHPSPVVLERLAKNEVECFRTDECGAVILKSNGKKITIKRTVY
jgi:competence protein ComEC